MTRKKVELSFIMNDAKRKLTYDRRKKGLLNKVSELSTLCGINACAIVYNPYDLEFEVWPDTMGVQGVISEFNKLSQMEKTRKMLNHETLLRQKFSKVNQKLNDKLIKNREKEIIELIFQCLLNGKRGIHNLMPQDLKDLGFEIEQKLEKINKRMDDLGNMVALQQVAPLPPSPQPRPPIPIALPPQTSKAMASQQVFPPPLQPLMLSRPNQVLPNIMQEQEHNHLHHLGDQGCGQVKENQVIMPSFSASNNQGYVDLTNPWDFL